MLSEELSHRDSFGTSEKQSAPGGQHDKLELLFIIVQQNLYLRRCI
jgi:hypothetical protein